MERQRPQGCVGLACGPGERGTCPVPHEPLSTSRLCTIPQGFQTGKTAVLLLGTKKLHQGQENSTFGWNRLLCPVSSSSLEDSPAGGLWAWLTGNPVGSGLGSSHPVSTGKTQEDDGGRNPCRLSRAQWVIQQISTIMMTTTQPHWSEKD